MLELPNRACIYANLDTKRSVAWIKLIQCFDAIQFTQLNGAIRSRFTDKIQCYQQLTPQGASENGPTVLI